MPSLDIFNGDEFNLVRMTGAINKLPKLPTLLDELGLFKPVPVSVTTVFVEKKTNGTLQLVQDQPRGGPPQLPTTDVRVIKPFMVPHYPMFAGVMADDVQGVRAFGSETELETVAQKVNDKLEKMRQSLDLTKEFTRLGAIQGIVLSKDGTVLANYFTEFGITEKVVLFDWSDGNLMIKAQEVLDHIEDNLGGQPLSEVIALCGTTFYENLYKHTETKDAMTESDNGWLVGQMAQSFEAWGIRWVRARGSLGGNPVIAETEARVVPRGPQMYEEVQAPANYVETVNTLGRPYYAKQERMKFDKGIEMEAQGNWLHVVNQPELLVKLTSQA